MVSVPPDASFHEYGMVTEQVTVVPVPRGTPVAPTSKIGLNVAKSITDALPTHTSSRVLANTELTVIVKFSTILPVNVVVAGGSAASGFGGGGVEWKIPVFGFR
jgi:hypothetical protein